MQGEQPSQIRFEFYTFSSSSYYKLIDLYVFQLPTLMSVLRNFHGAEEYVPRRQFGRTQNFILAPMHLLHYIADLHAEH